jgi:hypothetical protein
MEAQHAICGNPLKLRLFMKVAIEKKLENLSQKKNFSEAEKRKPCMCLLEDGGQMTLNH